MKVSIFYIVLIFSAFFSGIGQDTAKELKVIALPLKDSSNIYRTRYLINLKLIRLKIRKTDTIKFKFDSIYYKLKNNGN